MEKQLAKFQKRKGSSERFITLGGIFLIFGVLAFVFYLPTFVSVPVLVIGAILMILGGSGYAKVVHDFKHDFLVKFFGDLIEEGHYYPKRGLSSHQVYQCEFLKQADRFYTEDMITGIIDGVSFVSSDVKLEERRVQHTKNGTRTYYVKYFLGRLFVFDFNKNFDGVLHCLEQGRPTVKRKYQSIKLESIEFNKKFKTYATNPHSAFYILTPHFMESMLTFEKNNPGKLGFAFIDNKLYVGINNNKDTFSLTLYRKIDETLIESFKRDVKVIYDLIDDLKLNKKIFKEVT